MVSATFVGCFTVYLHNLSTESTFVFFCSWDCVKFRCLHQNDTGWWFGTFSIFHNIWDNPSHWFSYFSRWWLQHQPDMFQKTWKTRLKNIRLSSEHQIRIMEIVRQQKPEVLRVYTKNCWNVKASLTSIFSELWNHLFWGTYPSFFRYTHYMYSNNHEHVMCNDYSAWLSVKMCFFLKKIPLPTITLVS